MKIRVGASYSGGYGGDLQIEPDWAVGKAVGAWIFSALTGRFAA